MAKSLKNLKGVYDDLKKCAANFKGILLYLKAEEGSLKVLNNEFGANVEQLETALKLAQTKFQGESHEPKVQWQ